MRSIILIACLILSLSKDEEARSAVSKDEARYVNEFFSSLLEQIPSGLSQSATTYLLKINMLELFT